MELLQVKAGVDVVNLGGYHGVLKDGARWIVHTLDSQQDDNFTLKSRHSELGDLAMTVYILHEDKCITTPVWAEDDSSLQIKNYILNFWSMACEVCKEEMGVIEVTQFLNQLMESGITLTELVDTHKEYYKRHKELVQDTEEEEQAEKQEEARKLVEVASRFL